MAFDKSKHLIRVQGGREYLPVSARLIWFREEHPDWGIVTSPVEINLEKQYAIFSASIFNAEGKLMATATKMENVRGFPDYMEKAETGAVGRALAYCGYGTQFAPDLEESERFADAPRYGNGRMGGGRMNLPSRPGNGGNGFATGGNRPAGDARPAPASRDDEREEPAPFGDDAAPENRSSGDARPAGDGRPATPPPPRETAPSDEDDDPFAELSEPVRPAAPPVRAARAAAAAATNEAGEPVLSSNQCSVEGCTVTLTPGQVSMSTARYGRALCPRHQKEATPLADGGAPPRRSGAATADTLL